MKMSIAMKQLFITLVFLPAICFGQKQICIDSAGEMKKQTVYCRGKEMITGETYYFTLHFRGMGKIDDLIGKWVTYHPEAITHRKIKFVINN